MTAAELRTVPVRFKTGPLGLVDANGSHRFVEHVALEGEHGDLITEGELPFAVPDGWVLVKVGSLYCPVHPDWVETIRP